MTQTFSPRAFRAAYQQRAARGVDYHEEAYAELQHAFIARRYVRKTESSFITLAVLGIGLGFMASTAGQSADPDTLRNLFAGAEHIVSSALTAPT